MEELGLGLSSAEIFACSADGEGYGITISFLSTQVGVDSIRNGSV